MPDSKTQDIDGVYRDEAIDLEEQGEESIPEDQTGEFSGNELNESGHSAFAQEERDVGLPLGNETDEELRDKGPESVTEDPVEEPSDIHSDEPEELDEQQEEKSQSGQEDKPPETHAGVPVGRKGLSLILALVLVLLAGTGYFLMKTGKSPIDTTRQEEEAPIPDRPTRSEDQDLSFDSFVIPLRHNEEFTYISLSISFKLPNIRLRKEMIQKKDLLRGIIYNILEDEINRTKEVPSLEALKALIAMGVNEALVRGKVQEVFITQFLAV